MPWHLPQKPSLCQNQSDTGTAGVAGRPWGHTNDGTSCRLVRGGACRRRGTQCLQGESEGSVPGEVRHSLGEPSWRCHPCLLVRRLLRHTPASAAPRPRLRSALTCLWHSSVRIYLRAIEISKCCFRLWNAATQMSFDPQRQMMEWGDQAAGRERYTGSLLYNKSSWFICWSLTLVSGCSNGKWDKHVPSVSVHACESSANFIGPLTRQEARSQLLCTYSASAWTRSC